MNPDANAAPESPLAGGSATPAALAPWRLIYWSVRRELWENRSIYVAPLLVAAVFLLGFAISAIGLPERRRAVLALGEAKARAAIVMPYDAAAVMLLATAFVAGCFYCLDALHGERRDRSILFWKSLPVSDLMTVLSKASIPLLVLPLVISIVIVTTQLLMLLHTTTLLLVRGMDPGTTLRYFNPFRDTPILMYGLMVITLWHAPIYAWLLLVSSWARRAAVLWAILPWFAFGILEQITTGRSRHFQSLMRSRLFGGIERAFAFQPGSRGSIESLDQLRPGTFLATPGLWLGLLFAAACLAAAVRLRRNREPI